MVNFTNQDGSLNADGQRLHDFLEANMRHMEDMNETELNGQPGVFKYLFTNRKVAGMTTERFITDFGRTHANNAWAVMEALDERRKQAETVQETATKTNDIAAELESLKEQLAEATKAITTLKSANTKLNNKVKALENTEAKDEDTEAEAEEEEATDEPEAEEQDDQEAE